jgi:hypothetical protein
VELPGLPQLLSPGLAEGQGLTESEGLAEGKGLIECWLERIIGR